MDEESKTFHVKDMYLAAALKAYGHTLIQVDDTNPREQRFTFQDRACKIYVLNNGEPSVLEILSSNVERQFVLGNLLFPPTYPEEIKRIKAIIHRNINADKQPRADSGKILSDNPQVG